MVAQIDAFAGQAVERQCGRFGGRNRHRRRRGRNETGDRRVGFGDLADHLACIGGLAAQLGEQEYRLRRTINGQLGFRNFSAFLNSYRLAEVKAALADPAQRDVPIITIALDAGFGSLGPFNRAFREAEGMTPSEFRARTLADSGIG